MNAELMLVLFVSVSLLVFVLIVLDVIVWQKRKRLAEQHEEKMLRMLDSVEDTGVMPRGLSEKEAAELRARVEDSKRLRAVK